MGPDVSWTKSWKGFEDILEGITAETPQGVDSHPQDFSHYTTSSNLTAKAAIRLLPEPLHHEVNACGDVEIQLHARLIPELGRHWVHINSVNLRLLNEIVKWYIIIMIIIFTINFNYRYCNLFCRKRELINSNFQPSFHDGAVFKKWFLVTCPTIGCNASAPHSVLRH
jgi:hypothetical protein